MKQKGEVFVERLGTALFLLIVFFGVFFLLPPIIFSVCLLGLLFWTLYDECPRLQLGYYALVYPTLPFLLLVYLNQVPATHGLVLYIFFVSGLFDSVSYFVGSLFGKHKIIPRISPGKTWEGLCGGVTALLCANYLLLKMNYALQIIILMTLCLAIAAFFGDLFVSWLKRRVAIKDTGSCLPGHGGILDRFDSVLLVVIVVFLYVIA